ncbi:hypothetical protein ACFVYR_37235 [Streptomyces sp. NPDC058284]|uniref:hypothetical protein n=1 Tax=unclassified Streptomyces TaxID=2593676 RepID=UPI003664EF02
MRSYFADDLLLLLPLTNGEGLQLHGEVLGTHRGPLALSLADEATHSPAAIGLDLTHVSYVADSVVWVLLAVARRLGPGQHLDVRAGPELNLRERFSRVGENLTSQLRLTDA